MPATPVLRAFRSRLRRRAGALRVGGYEMALARSGKEALDRPGVRPVDFKELVDAVIGPGL